MAKRNVETLLPTRQTSYRQTILDLFGVLAQCNMADSDWDAHPWQDVGDCGQRECAFGFVYNAIKSLAGEAVLDHWCETNEIDLSLCDRISRA